MRLGENWSLTCGMLASAQAEQTSSTLNNWSLICGLAASIVTIFVGVGALIKWREMMASLSGKYKHYNEGKAGEVDETNEDMGFILHRPWWLRWWAWPLFLAWPFCTGGKLNSGKGTPGKWRTNLWGTSITLEWADTIIRAAKKADGVYEGYHVKNGQVKKKTQLLKVSDEPNSNAKQ